MGNRLGISNTLLLVSREGVLDYPLLADVHQRPQKKPDDIVRLFLILEEIHRYENQSNKIIPMLYFLQRG